MSKKNQLSVKYPKKLGGVEVMNKRGFIQSNPNPQFINEQTKLKEEREIVILKRMFELNGAYPFLIDGINFFCTYSKQDISFGDDLNFSFNAIKDDFEVACLGKELKYRKRFIEEVARLTDDSKKILPYDDNFWIVTKPVTVDKMLSNTALHGLFNIKTGEQIKATAMYRIGFNKYLWKCLMEGTHGVNYFDTPAHFQTKIITTINTLDNRYRGYPVYDKKGGDILARKLYIYMQLHDNSISETIKYDLLDITKSLLPSNMHTGGGREYVRDWNYTRQMVAKGVELFNHMDELGYMQGVKFKPNKVSFDKHSKKILVKIERKPKRVIEGKNNISQ